MTATIGLPRAPRTRGRSLLVATGFACAASVMYFGGLFGVYLSQRAQTRLAGVDWIPDGAVIELTTPGMIMWTLLLSIPIMQWAVYAIARDDRKHGLLALGAALAMGALVIVQYAWHYSQMGLVIDGGDLASVLIYVITGSHLVMMIVAMIFVALMGFRALAGQYSSFQTDGIVAATIYWDTTAFVYLFIWIGVFIAR